LITFSIVGITIRIQFDIRILTPKNFWSGQEISATQLLYCKVQKRFYFNIANQDLIHRRWNHRLHFISFHFISFSDFSKSFSISYFWAQEKQNGSWKFWILRIDSVFNIQFSRFAAVSRYLSHFSLILQYFSIYCSLSIHFTS
jgi:hypothetical protein